MPTIYFRHSYIYESLLSKTCGEQFTQEDFRHGLKATEEFTQYWNKFNNDFFEYYKNLGFVMSDFWMAYLVRPKKNLVPFSDPLTIFINPDMERMAFILIHELCHVLQVYPDNDAVTKKIYDHVNQVFPGNFDVNVELVTILLARGFLLKTFGKDKVLKFDQEEHSLPGLLKPWEIIDKQPEILEESDPMQAILKLSKIT